MAKKLFLLDGMALVYRAHFALISRPIFTSKGVNSSALYGFTQTLLDIIKNQQPTHLGLVFDTDAPTQRHVDFPAYKAQREAMPEDLSEALPHVQRLAEAFNIPVLSLDGWEADDLIGTLVRAAEKDDFDSFMVTPDKDFGQLVGPRTRLYRPSRMGDGVEILGVEEIKTKWGIAHVEQVIDILGLWGDTSDNIPGVPGIGEKTAAKLIGQYGSVENLLAHTAELKGKLKENLETFREQALLSKKLATICCDAPISLDIERFRLRPRNDEQIKTIFIEFEFNSIGRRLYGDDFRTGRGFAPAPETVAPKLPDLEPVTETAAPPVVLKKLEDTPHDYRTINTPAERRDLVRRLAAARAFAFCAQTTGSDPKQSRLLGLAFCLEPHVAYYVPLSRPDSLPPDSEALCLLAEFQEVFASPNSEKIGHDLKFDVNVLLWHGMTVAGRLVDTMLAYSLGEPERRHTLPSVAEACLGYEMLKLGEASPALASEVSADDESEGEPQLLPTPPTVTATLPGLENALAYAGRMADCACERADVAWHLRATIDSFLEERGQTRVYQEVEAPLISVLAEMEYEGIRIDAAALAEFGIQLSKQIVTAEKTIFQLAGTEFNLNSPKQLGEILFDVLKLADKPKKTRTGQYATNEQTLLTLAGEHEIVRHLLDYRVVSKLKSTYVDTLPSAVWAPTGRVHTTYHQLATSTGRLNSQNPNLQNIPIRTEKGQEIRKAFVPRDDDYLLLSADYSQIELRIIAALSDETAMIEAFRTATDIHTATAARVFGVFLEMVTPEMRRKAKMVNYGIAYGISPFGLAQRLGIPRKEAATIIEQYFAQFPGIANYMRQTVASCQQLGYVETVTGRRRYLRDIRSSNATVRGSAERNAINAPIQGSAADMIKLAMVAIQQELKKRGLKSRLLLQVHDELVFDLYRPEQEELQALVSKEMSSAMLLKVPIEVESGVGRNWLEAH